MKDRILGTSETWQACHLSSPAEPSSTTVKASLGRHPPSMQALSALAASVPLPRLGHGTWVHPIQTKKNCRVAAYAGDTCNLNLPCLSKGLNHLLYLHRRALTDANAGAD